MSLDEADDALRSNQWHVAVEHDYRTGAKVFTGRLERVTGTQRLLLDNDRHAVAQMSAQRLIGRVDDDGDSEAPAPLAAATGQAIIGRPQIGCSSFGVRERIAVPWPAARITTTGAVTARIVVQGPERKWSQAASACAAAISASCRYQSSHFRTALSDTPYLRPTATMLISATSRNSCRVMDARPSAW